MTSSPQDSAPQNLAPQNRATVKDVVAQQSLSGPKPGFPLKQKGRSGPSVVEVLPMAQPAHIRKRHRALMWSLVGFVLVPLALVAAYLWGVAEDRYSSTAAFTVRAEEGGSATDLLGGLAQFAGTSTSGDSDLLYEFIRSQSLVERIDNKLDLRSYYATRWTTDPVFALWPEASIEDLHWFWDRIVKVSYDQSTGLIELLVFSYDAEMARTIAREIVSESQHMVNALSDAAQSDAIRYAEADLELTQSRLKQARQAMTQFRTRTQIVDLEADIQGRMGVMNTLQQQLATELVLFDELSKSARGDDPRLAPALRRIQVIRDRIAAERREFATTEVLGTGEDYPTLISEFEGLNVEREFAETAYSAALAALDGAKANAIRQSRYLATYIDPTLAEEAEYPRRFILFGLAALFLTLGWGILALVYYSLRDRS